MISASTFCSRAAALVAAATVVVPVLAGCSQEPKVIRPYTPAAGVAASNDSVDLRNIVLVNEDGQARLSGLAVSTMNDTITGVTGQALTSDDARAAALAPSTTRVALTGGQAVNLDTKGIQVSSARLTDGLLATITISFAKSEPLTLRAPVISASNPDFTPAAPTPSSTPKPATSTPTPTSTPS